MFAQIQSLNFVLLRYAQSHRGVQDFQQDERHHRREDPGDGDAHDLPDEDARGLLRSSPALAVVDVPAGPRGKDAGQDRTQRAADAVHAEGIQRIVVAKLDS